MKIVLSHIFVLLILAGCSSEPTEELEVSEEKNEISDSVFIHYKEVYDWNSVIGSNFWTCDETDESHFEYLRTSASTNELMLMLQDTSGYGFKIFAVQQIHKRNEDNDEIILELFENDSTEVLFVTSCLGLAYNRKFNEVCRTIIEFDVIDHLEAPEVITVW